MTMERQKSDDCVVPEGRRKAVPTGVGRGGKAVTVNKQTGQLALFGETAASPQGSRSKVGVDPSTRKSKRVPKSPDGTGTSLPPITMEAVADEQNLKAAFTRVASNRGAPGPDGESIEEVRKHLEVRLKHLSRSLLEGSHKVGDIRRVWIPKKSGGQRGLGIPNVIDRIAQQATYQVLSPHYEPEFHEGSHGFRPGRSCHTAIKQAKEHLEAGMEWVVDIDLSKFFDEVGHDRLMSRLERKVSDRRVLKLLRQMLRARVVMPDGVVMENEKGTPQGGPLSPLLSNIVLDELDQELGRRGHRFVRYADDCNVYVKTERSGRRVMASLTDFIERKMKLKVNRDKSAVDRPRNRKFLGLTLMRLKSGRVRVLVSKEALAALRSKLKEMSPRNWGASLQACLSPLNRYMRGWLGYFGICDPKQIPTLGREDAHLRRRLRALQLKQWKKKRLIQLHLVRLGIPPPLVRRDLYGGRRGWWMLTRCHAINRALTNAHYERQGLVSLAAQWRKEHERIWDIGPAQLTLLLG
jgi:RNA-directed DNA polymerase